MKIWEVKKHRRFKKFGLRQAETVGASREEGLDVAQTQKLRHLGFLVDVLHVYTFGLDVVQQVAKQHSVSQDERQVGRCSCWPVCSMVCSQNSTSYQPTGTFVPCFTYVCCTFCHVHFFLLFLAKRKTTGRLSSAVLRIWNKNKPKFNWIFIKI